MHGLVDPSFPVNWAAPLNRGLTYWWYAPYGGQGAVVRDLCRNRANLTLSSGTNTRIGASGVGLDKLVYFDRSSHWTVSSQPYAFSTAVTLEFYIQPGFASTSTSTYDLINIGAAGAGLDPRLFLRYETVSSVPRWILDSSGTMRYDQNAPVAFAAGDWLHLLVTTNGTTGQYYVNGNAATTVAVTSTSLQNISSQPVFLGELTDSFTTRKWLGGIGSVRIYDRLVSAAMALDLYRSCKRGYQRELNWLTTPLYAPEQAAGAAFDPANGFPYFENQQQWTPSFTAVAY